MKYFYGKIEDSQTGRGIPGATIAFLKNSQIIKQTPADSGGNFAAWIAADVNFIHISSVGYKPFSTPLTEFQHQWELEKDYQELPPVVLPPKIKIPKQYLNQGNAQNKFVLPAIAILALLIILKNK